MPTAVITRLAEVLKAEVGYHEGPKNNETKYGAAYGFNFVAWCAIFLSWGCAKVGANYLGKPWRFASTIAARDHAKKNNRWITKATVGTIAMMAHSSTTGHVGYLIGLVMKSGVLYTVTVEGNTNAQGSREGDQVAIRTRVASSWDGFIVLDETYGGDTDDMSAEAERKISEIHDIIFGLTTPDGKKHNSIQEIWIRTANLEAVATRDIETLAPLIKEVLKAVKEDDSPSSGGSGNVDPDAFVNALAARLVPKD